MAETKRTLDDFINASTGTLKDNVAGDISAEYLRDFVVTAFDGLYSGAISTADSNPTAVVGDILVLDISGYTADRTLTLPVAANLTTGDRCGVMISTGDDTYELLLKSGAAGDLINGTDHSSTTWSKLCITGEVVIFRCINGTTGDWIVEYDGRIPQQCELRRDAVQGINSGAVTLVEVDASSYDIGDIGDIVTNDRITVRRDGKYIVMGFASIANLDDGEYLINYAYVNGVAAAFSSAYSPAASKALYIGFSRAMELNDGDYVDLRILHNEGAQENTLTTAHTRPRISVTEQL